ncbi:MJ0042-type zinc finger domain-containing protein [Sphingomonas immobilis]|uniref:Zinc-ribbon domain-containing protein n=1 Tax=Sphingomonas immobilis TaxID=3063997 RepID=A0ABT8ZUY5_9SPHN|nr:MJ0042-type zinc finger domain-containing protein [Sphingomonas sp. CA1-15]MDO7841388.1 zinc-ribbon domain-containing protein [Sphingomonas sp. CA1-15]
MILECPECRTRYLVPDTAIGVDGRTVRCASCKHSWFQEGPEVLDLVARAAEPAPAPPPSAAPEPAYAESPREPDGVADDFDAFAHQPPFRPRRNPARRWTIAAIAAGLVMLIAAAGVLYSGAPGLAFQLGLPMGTPETPLKIVSKPIDHHDLDNGSEIFAISGNVVNPTDTRQQVPDIRAELRDEQGRLVYSWMIRPDAMVLPPRGQVAFNSAKLDVPVNAKRLVLSFSGEAKN